MRLGNARFLNVLVLFLPSLLLGSDEYTFLRHETFDTCFLPGELAALGIHPTPRKHIDVKMSTGEWDAGRVQGHIWHILVGEAMGYNSIYHETNDDAIDCCDAAKIFPETDVYLENWNPLIETLVANEDCEHHCILSMSGFKGSEAIFYAKNMNNVTFVNSDLGLGFPTSKFWNPGAVGNWRDPALIAAVKDYTSHDLATLAGVTINGYEYPAGTGETVDGPHRWFVPEWCKDRRLTATENAGKDDCAEWIFHTDSYGPTYPQVVRNLELRVIITWWSFRAGTMLEYVLQNDYPAFVYYWGPDPILVRNGEPPQHIIMKPFSEPCFVNDKTIDLGGGLMSYDLDNGTGSVDCERAVSDLHRIARAERFEANPDLYNIFRRMLITQTELDSIFMAKPVNSTVAHWHDQACDWLKANPTIWTDWIMNSPEPEIMRIVPNVIVQIIGYIDLVISIIVNFIMVSWIRKHRDMPLIKAVSPAFMIIAALAGMTIGISGVFFGFDAYQMGIDICWVRIGLMCFSNSTLFCALFVKTMRVYKIFKAFKNKTLQVVILTNKILMRYLGIMLFPVIIFVIWNAVATREAGWVKWESADKLSFTYMCPEPAATSWLIGITMCYAIATLLMAYFARNIPSDYNEIIHILYLTMFWTLLTAFTLFVWGNTTDVDTQALMACLYGICCGIIVEISVLGPKFALLLGAKEEAERKATLDKDRAQTEEEKNMAKQIESCMIMGEQLQVLGPKRGSKTQVHPEPAEAVAPPAQE